MAEIDVNAYATTAANAAATLPSIIETQQPAGTGALRQVVTLGDPTTRANMQKVTAAGQGQVTTPDVATTGALAALNAAVTTAVNSQGIVAIQLTGTWVGTVTFQGTQDPTGAAAATTSWFNVNGVQSVSGAQLASTTNNGQYRVNSGGYTAVRVIMTVFTSGSATVWMNASLAPSMATLAEPLPAGTNNIGKVTAGSSTTGGATPFTLISAATTNATSVKASAGTIYGIQASNTGAAIAFLKIYNLATAPTVGTSVAVKTLPLPVGGGIVLSSNDIGVAYGTGIAIAVTGLAATADVTAVALNQVVVNIDYA